VQVEVWDTDARLAHVRLRRQQAARRRRRQRLAVAGAAAAVLAFVGAAFLYAGSPGRLADGVTIAGVDVGGLSPQQAIRLLERREAALAAEPLPVRVDGREYEVRAAALGVAVNWRAAVTAAQDRADGFRPLRGFRRMVTRAFGTNVTPTASADDKALERLVARLSRGDTPHRDALIRLAGLRPIVIREKAGLGIDPVEARSAILGAFAALERSPVVLRRSVDEPRVTAEMLAPALAKTRVVVSRPVRLELGTKRITVSKRQLARIIELPSASQRSIDIAGPGADAYFKALQSEINRRPRSADFVPVPGGRVLIKPALLGQTLDVPRTADALLRAALRPTRRQAQIVAKAMGVTGLVSSYTTIYGGDANRVHNVQLVANLIDDTLIRPGATFSFNGTTGERNAAKGFLEAPVIINGELQTGLGGGVCQVSTTVFNAAYEGGLDITARTNHALYISHYPQGRDATVNYPDTDLKFVNDTGKWLLLRSFVGSSSLTVNLYGTPQHRRVETEVAPLKTVGTVPTTWRKDPALTKGTRVVTSEGSPARSTSVHRLVYAPNGDLLYDNTWSSYYRGEKRVIMVGTKPKPEKPKEKAAKTAIDAPTGGSAVPAEPAPAPTTPSTGT
jgi:vancomycin resistance protein YoaR